MYNAIHSHLLFAQSADQLFPSHPALAVLIPRSVTLLSTRFLVFHIKVVHTANSRVSVLLSPGRERKNHPNISIRHCLRRCKVSRASARVCVFGFFVLGCFIHGVYISRLCSFSGRESCAEQRKWKSIENWERLEFDRIDTHTRARARTLKNTARQDFEPRLAVCESVWKNQLDLMRHWTTKKARQKPVIVRIYFHNEWAVFG